MKTKEYDLIEGNQTKLVILVRGKNKIPIDLSGATNLKLYYTNAGVKTSRNMTAPIPSNGKMEYRFLLDEIKAGDLEVSGEFMDAGNHLFTQTNPTHLKVGSRP